MIKDNQKTNKFRVIGIVLFLTISILWMYFNDKNIEKQRKLEDKIYPEIVDIRHSVSGRAISIHPSSVWNGSLLIMLDNQTKFSLSKTTYNRNYKTADLNSFIQESDSIYKPAHRDSIYIYRPDSNNTYNFVYGKVITKNHLTKY